MTLDTWCAHCKAGFPVAVEPSGWVMGKLRRLTRAPRWIRERLQHTAGDYLCGNCYFDLLDARGARGEGRL